MNQVYLDNSATSFPKPPVVINAMAACLRDYSGSPGRSAHQYSVRASRVLFETRELIAKFFNAPSSERVIFTLNATHALNIAIHGMLKQGDHVIISSMEHNSVVRPLRQLEQQGKISVTVVQCNNNGVFDLELFQQSFTAQTKLVITQHGSNVTGTVFPVKEIGKICRKHSVPYLVDAAQTAGCMPINLVTDNIDLLVFTGHKHLLGPTGTGGLIVNTTVDPLPLLTGGTGSASESEIHPLFYPDRLESGTPNTVGIAGLGAGIKYILDLGMDEMMQQQRILTNHLINRLSSIMGAETYGQCAIEAHLPVVSMNLKGWSPSDLALQLDRDYGIMTRPGLHCAPLAHKTLGAFPEGTLRFSIGPFNTMEEIDYTVRSVQQIIKQ